MAKFFKSNVSEEQALQDLIRSEDISSPFYFPPSEDQMRQKEVAAMFNRTVQTISAWTEKGKIPHFRVGKFPIYSRKQLIAHASKNQNLLSPNK